MPRFAANLSFLYRELDFLDRFDAAAAAGFEAVEYHFPYEHDPAVLAARLRDNGLTQVLHNLPAGDWSAGERGIAVLPDRVAEFRDGVARAAEYATTLGCRQLNCLAGIAPPGVDAATLTGTLVENLGFAAAELARLGIRLLVEPINTRDIPGFHLNTTRQAMALIEAVGSDNLFDQYDVYHMQIMEGDLAVTLQTHLPRIGHLQLADNPGRHEPGSGEINFPFLFAHLDRLGYGGWIGCEYEPAAGTDEGLGWVRPYLRAAAPARRSSP